MTDQEFGEIRAFCAEWSIPALGLYPRCVVRYEPVDVPPKLVPPGLNSPEAQVLVTRADFSDLQDRCERLERLAP